MTPCVICQYPATCGDRCAYDEALDLQRELETRWFGKPAPYYEAPDGYGALYQGDVLQVLSRLPERSVSCVVTDPPYNVGKNFGNGRKADLRENYNEWLNEIWAACGRVVHEGGFLIFTNRIAHLPMGMLAVPEPWRLFHVGVWHKPLSLAGCWYSIAPHWEPIFFYVQGKPWRHFRSEFVMSDVRSHNVVHGSDHTHPTQKPLGLMRDLVEFGCPEDGVVLDPMCGSGTTLVAARQLGRRYIGIELSASYAALARRKLERWWDPPRGRDAERPPAQAALPLGEGR